MSNEYTEYTFTLPDGTERYEIVETAEALTQARAFQRMHGATGFAPTALLARLRATQAKPRKPQDFDTSALPLFGDGAAQIDLIDLLAKN